jgi:NAD(P)-dependent dehydrogenase (short-subunit alcohol dehydrogenase family)
MRVVVNYRSSRGEADDVVDSIRSAGGQVMAAQADVRDASAVRGMVEQVRAAMGEVEVLVHNALIPYAIKSFDEISADELGGKVEQEIRAAFVMTKAVVPGMTKRGYGRIVYLGTVLSERPREGMIALGTSKAALGSFARFVAQELGPRGITVNVVAPGPVAETNIGKAALAVDPAHLAPDDPAVTALLRANRRALRTIHDQPDLAARYVNALIPSLTKAEACRYFERYVAPYFTADGRHDPGVGAQAVPSVAQELGVPTVPDTADLYRTEPAERPAA